MKTNRWIVMLLITFMLAYVITSGIDTVTILNKLDTVSTPDSSKYKQLYILSQQENNELKSKLRYSDSLLNCCVQYDLDCTKRNLKLK